MRKMALLILISFLILGTYLSQSEKKSENQVMIEDEVGSTMAAPDIPL